MFLWADNGYKRNFVEWVKETLGWDVEIVQHPWSGLRGVWVPEGVEVDWEKSVRGAFTSSNDAGWSNAPLPGWALLVG